MRRIPAMQADQRLCCRIQLIAFLAGGGPRRLPAQEGWRSPGHPVLRPGRIALFPVAGVFRKLSLGSQVVVYLDPSRDTLIHDVSAIELVFDGEHGVALAALKESCTGSWSRGVSARG